MSRRHFVKIMSASFLLAGMGLAGSGCRRPVEHLEPFGKQPPDYVYGTSQYYATAMPTRCGAVPLVAKSYEGRPVKLEGNALYPGGNGGTDRWTQASILNLYDPDRARRFTQGGNNTTPAAALDFLRQLSEKFTANQGEGLAFLAEPGTSPSRARLRNILSAKMPKAMWVSFDPLDLDIHRRVASAVFGRSVRPQFRFDEAKVILSLDCDFIGSEEDAHNHIRQFAQGRRIENPADSLNRLYVVESLLTLTGAGADHRLRVQNRYIPAIAAAIAKECGVSNAGWDLGDSAVPGVNPKWISECAKDLLANKGRSLVVAGYHQPAAIHAVAHALNAALGNVGATVLLLPAPEGDDADLMDLAKRLGAGAVDTLVILGGNPVYNAPAFNLGSPPAAVTWAELQRNAKTVVRLGYYEDETFERCDWHIPAAHFLESWGDVLTSDGALVPVQPLIAPLFGGLTEIEVLARLAGERVTSPYEITRQTFVGAVLNRSDRRPEDQWRRFLYNGFLDNSAAQPVQAALDLAAVAKVVASLKALSSAGDGNLEVVFRRDYKVDDGRYTNNGWLQELPDPITKLAWDNAVLVSRKTARELGVVNGDVVRITLLGRLVEGPIWVQPGQADKVLGLTLGYGRPKPGRVGAGTGFNAYAIRTTFNAGNSALEFSADRLMHFATGASVEKAGRTYPLSCTQNHWSMEGRPIVREANLEQFREHPDFASREKLEEPPVISSLYPNPLDQAKAKGLHQWGMSVDLNTCVGCGTCVVACQSENNIPIVGKDQVRRGRSMHWMRVDRYYAGNPEKGRTPDLFKTDKEQQFEEWIDDPQSVMQPMFCQHCEAAPCENVCPVNATTHDNEGLNLMVYNRCVGTRYCSNNCPYKVRRFNFLDFNKRSLKELKGPFYPTPLTHGTDGEWDLLRWWRDPTEPTTGMRPEDEWDLIKMSKNPDVTVRMRGVMEKCTLCLQRIEQAKIAQKVKAGASGDVRLKESEATVPQTACQQACPAGALVFGDISDPESRVSKLKAGQRDYSVLDNLFTRPRVTYLARVRNPNPAMPDYQALPLSLEEFRHASGGSDEESGGLPAAGDKEHSHG